VYVLQDMHPRSLVRIAMIHAIDVVVLQKINVLNAIQKNFSLSDGGMIHAIALMVIIESVKLAISVIKNV
jgi:hypothetical protein